MDDAADPVDVDAAGGDVGGDDRPGPPGAEVLEGPLALALAPVAVDGDRSDTPGPELLGDPVGPPLGAAEDDGRAGARHDAGDQVGAVSSLDRPVQVLGGVAVGVGAGLLVAHRVVHVATDDHVDVTVERGREQQRLALRGAGVEQALDLGQEAHVGHAVRLVQHHQVDLAQAHVALVDQVGQATGAGHGDVDAVAQGAQLVAEADPAVERLDGLLRVGELTELVADLRGQLAGGGQDERTGVVRAGPADVLHQRDAERQGLAGAGRRAAADVAAGERRRQRGGLDGEGRGDATVGERACQPGGDAERLEGGNGGGGDGVGRRGRGGGGHRDSSYVLRCPGSGQRPMVGREV